MKPAYKSERRGPRHDRGGSCGTATSFTRATIECALLDLANVNIIGRLECSGKVRRPQGSTRFSTSRRRPGPRDNHQEGRWRDKRAFCSLRLVFVALLLTHPRFRSRFSHLRAPKKRPSAPSSGVVIDASSMWAWWMKPKLRRGSQVRFLLLPEVRGAWHVP